MWLKIECELEKIHSIILSVTYHDLRNIPLPHTHPLTSIVDF